MDRLSRDLEDTSAKSDTDDGQAVGLTSDAEPLVEQSARHAAVPEGLFNLEELDVLYDADTATLWSYMRPKGRPSFTPPMLKDFATWQELIREGFGPDKVPLDYLVLGSRSRGVFCFGGDLELFQALIRDKNRSGLVEYGFRCVEILHRNMYALDLPMLTIGLVEGAALGGGFEALLSFDVIIAERGATFGLPEVLFGLFPGMGAHAILSRKLGTALAEQLILSNETYSAEYMHEIGLVHHLAEPGEGLELTRDYIARSTRRHSGLVNAKRAMRVASPVPIEELKRIVELWADAALNLRDQDLKVMSRLAAAQARLARADAA